MLDDRITLLFPAVRTWEPMGGLVLNDPPALRYTASSVVSAGRVELLREKLNAVEGQRSALDCGFPIGRRGETERNDE